MRASQERRLIEDGLTTSKSVAEVSVLMKNADLIRRNPAAVAFITRRQYFRAVPFNPRDSFYELRLSRDTQVPALGYRSRDGGAVLAQAVPKTRITCL